MLNAGHIRSVLVAAILVSLAVSPAMYAQAKGNPNSYPNPYQTVTNWAQLPDGRSWGQVAAVEVGDAGYIWVYERCGGNSCADSKLDPILKFDSSGKLLASFGGGLILFPHGMAVDKDGNVWVADNRTAPGKGQQAIKFSPDGKVLMRLGTAGVVGTGPDTFNMPSDIAIAPNGDIFVSDGHGGDSNARIVKFSKDGKFIKTWGKRGSGPGEFDSPHALAFDSRGRLYVADKGNSWIQIFDQDGNFIEQWTQFGKPSGVFIDKNDNLYVADSESNNARNPGYQRGIRIGSAKDGSVRAFIPDPNTDPDFPRTSAAEGVAADDNGVIYGSEVGPRDLKKYVKN